MTSFVNLLYFGIAFEEKIFVFFYFLLSVEASGEKHIPVVTQLEGNRLRIEVGSVHHPMLPEHHIAFIYVETDKGGIRINLNDEPVAEVCLGDAKATAVYEYCNLHGLWKVEL